MVRGRGSSRGRGWKGSSKRKRIVEAVESEDERDSASKSSGQKTKRVRWDGDVDEAHSSGEDEQEGSTEDSMTEKVRSRTPNL